jgi:ATP-dependent Clp protease ATP-binding subunit ClpC
MIGANARGTLMFEKYTEKARRVIFFARYEASQFGSPYIETEHLLLGLLREDKALTNRFLRGHAQVEAIRKQIEDHTVMREKVSTSVDLPLSNEGKRVLGYAVEEAARLSHQHIGTEHLLLGLLREENSFAAQLLKERGIVLLQIREELSAKAHESSAPTLGRQTSSLLTQFSVSLTQSASEEKLPPLVGREEELDRILQVLGRSAKNNAVLVGERGVGKRTIVEGLAQRLADGTAPTFIGRESLIALDLSLIVAAVQHSARSKEFLKALAAEIDVAAAGTIFFFDELHALLAAGPAGGALEITLLLKKALLSGEVRCIASATPEVYALARKKAPWLDRCFIAVEVQPATEAQAIMILQASKERFEKFHGVQYAEDALTAAVVYSNRHIKDRFLPDKAIDLIDDAGALVKMQRGKGALPDEINECAKRIKLIVHRMENAIAGHEFEKARFYSEEERKERKTLDELRQKYNVENPQASMVTREHVEEVLARWTGTPLAAIREENASNPAAETEQRSPEPPQGKKQNDKNPS